MRTKLYKITAFSSVLMVLLLGSCKDFLTEDPLTQITSENYFRTVNDVQSAMAGLYSSFRQEMTGGGTSSTAGKYFYWGEVRSDNFDKSQYGGTMQNEITLNQITSGNSMSDWTGLYRTISRANVNLEYIPKVAKYDNKATPDTINKYMSQCYAMRAMCYFYIVRLWGDAPIWTAPYEDLSKDPKKAKSPKDTIINSIILPDLLKAYDLMKKGQTANVWYINEGAICATLADVYMWKGDYNNAMTWFGNLFNAKSPLGTTYGVPSGSDSSHIEKAATWKNVFLSPSTSPEGIWSIYFDLPTSTNSPNLPVSTGYSNSGLKPDSAVFDGTAAHGWTGSVDSRARQTIDILQAGWGNLLKYYPKGTLTSKSTTLALPAYLVMYRLSDMYLLYAEALNQTGNSTAAVNIVNLMRSRANVKKCTDPSTWNVPNIVNAVEDTILNERHWELFGEGKRWFDLIRTYHAHSVMSPIIKQRLRRYYGSTYDPSAAVDDFSTEDKSGRTIDPKELWPLNRTILNDNVNLTQNNPYN
ncbi:MAG: RagB/SusD family nutrient uptake outer membrane protein [Bacteroidota bacterium]|nr:RagB/SusD family nutrient uptake outer membrane protein [Bacteroidota bacterium]MDP4273223.1 RagB/SusD family nutrient uptake outer membrane protein [Bacteroidota bacterium]